ncbi:hypothetical protein SESBI_37967 [Sesbania bispinosa]|nr:hypothetical protein SESBI_37967 [Sesbania bispinosa]
MHAVSTATHCEGHTGRAGVAGDATGGAEFVGSGTVEVIGGAEFVGSGAVEDTVGGDEVAGEVIGGAEYLNL